MKNIVPIIGLVLLGSLLVPIATRANYGGRAKASRLAFDSSPAYGVRYSTSVRTPPHFAVNPPVYYGRRGARDHGASSVAALPLVTTTTRYPAQPAAEPVTPPLGPLHFNPYCLGVPQRSVAGDSSVAGDGAESVQGERISPLSNPLEVTAVIVGKIRDNPLASIAGVARQPHQRSLTR